eukprot:symbB.v1.2.015707.t3/scaffold1182.1/size133383/2
MADSFEDPSIHAIKFERLVESSESFDLEVKKLIDFMFPKLLSSSQRQAALEASWSYDLRRNNLDPGHTNSKDCEQTALKATDKMDPVLLRSLHELRVNPSQVTLVTWLKLLGRCGAYDEAFQVVKNCESLYNCKPSVIHYTCLMSGCFRAKNYDQAWLAYELMKENGVQADETTMSTLIAGMVQGQQWSKVLALVGAASVAQLRPLRGVLMSMERNAPNGEVLKLKALLKARS